MCVIEWLNMNETVVTNKIRDHVQKTRGTILHKYHGDMYGETGVADLFGTMPDGRAIYIEVKKPFTASELRAFLKSDRYTNQRAWLAREARLGAIAMFANSVECVDKSIEKFYEQLKSSIKSGVFEDCLY